MLQPHIPSPQASSCGIVDLRSIFTQPERKPRGHKEVILLLLPAYPARQINLKFWCEQIGKASIETLFIKPGIRDKVKVFNKQSEPLCWQIIVAERSCEHRFIQIIVPEISNVIINGRVGIEIILKQNKRLIPQRFAQGGIYDGYNQIQHHIRFRYPSILFDHM